MLDIKFLRENPEVVKQNIRNKFQDQKLELVDKVIELDKENRDIKQEVEALRAKRNKISKQIGALMGQGKREEAEEVKKQVAVDGSRIEALSAREKEVEEEIKKIMMVIPNIIDPSVPIGKDDSENVEAERFGEPVVPDYDLAMDVRKAFFVLSEEEQILVGLSVFGGYCSQEIGEMMRLNPNTVRSKRSRALKKMECVLGSYGETEHGRKE